MKFKKSIFIQWLLIEAVILLGLFIGLSSITYYRFENILKKEIDYYSGTIFDQFIQMNELNLTSIRNFAGEVALQGELKKMVSNEKELNPAATQAFINNLVIQLSSNDCVSDAYIYLRKSKKFVSLKGVSDINFIIDYFHNNGRYTRQQWENILEYSEKDTWYPNIDKKSNIEYQNGVSLVHPCYKDGAKSAVVLVVIIDTKDYFSKLGNGLDNQNGKLMITENKQVILSNTGLTSFPTETFLKDYYVELRKSQVYDLCYYSLVPKKAIYEKIGDYKQRICVRIIIFLVLIVMVCILVNYQKYKPIKKIIENDKALKNNQKKTFESEFSVIEYTLNNLHRRNYEITKANQHYLIEFTNQAYIRLLQGQFTSAERFYQYLNRNGIQPLRNNLVMYLVKIKGYDETFFNNEKYFDQLISIKFIIGNISSDLFKEEFIYEIIDNKKEELMLIFEVDNRDGEEKINQGMNYLKTYLDKHFSFVVVVESSEKYNNIINLTKAYSEIRHKIDDKLLMESLEYDEQDEKIHERGKTYLYTQKTENHLRELLKKSERKLAKELIQKLFRETLENMHFLNRQHSSELVTMLYYDICGTILKAYNKIPDTNLNIVLPEYTSKEDMMSRLFALIDNLPYKESEQLSDEHQLLLNKVLDFINKNYGNKELNVSYIGNEYNLSPYYLSTLFKKNIGEGLHTYIERQRIEKAKILITETQLKINEILDQVGYSNSKTFSRSFKKIVGVTPSKYRQINIEFKKTTLDLRK